jgi:hypothetical protein
MSLFASLHVRGIWFSSGLVSSLLVRDAAAEVSLQPSDVARKACHDADRLASPYLISRLLMVSVIG